MTPQPTDTPLRIAFIGGGNMASAIIGGLRRDGLPADHIQVVEPLAAQRAQLASEFGVDVLDAPGDALGRATLVVWAVKPQTFEEAARAAAGATAAALHLSVAAGIRTDSMAAWLGTDRIVRCMPNTPALIGQGMTGLFARAAVTPADRLACERVIATTGEHLWLSDETQLDAVTALSGSGPAYVFYFLEAMQAAGVEMGLPAEQALKLATATFSGAAALAAASPDSPEVLRSRVTSKGGTTYAALTAMDEAGIKPQFIKAMHAACRRAAALGDEFGSK